MLGLKNPFAVKPATLAELPGSAGTIPQDAKDKIWGAQMTVERANKAWERKTAEWVETRSSREQLDRIIGEKNADGVDASAEVHRRQAVDSLVIQLESAVAVLLQRKQEAEAKWTRAKRLASIETAFTAMAHLKRIGHKVDAWFEDGKRLVEQEVIPALAMANATDSDGIHRNALFKAQLEFKRLLLHNVCALIPEGAVPERQLEFKKWSDAIPDPDSVRTAVTRRLI